MGAFDEAVRPVPSHDLLGGVPATTDTAPDLSVVIPAFDEAGRIEPTLMELQTWLRDTFCGTCEVIVVDDGSSDDTARLSLAAFGPELRVVRFDRNRGKGEAVRAGMMVARGRWRAFLDADGSTPPAELSRLLAVGRPVVIASVEAEGAEVDHPQSRLRSAMGRLGNRVIQHLVLPGIVDSQRGCKVFRGDVADAVFPPCRTTGWGFDVEVLARARSLGFEPQEIGVVWEHRPVGHVRPWHYVTTIVEVLRIRRMVGRPPIGY